jgi:hypothetical protein
MIDCQYTSTIDIWNNELTVHCIAWLTTSMHAWFSLANVVEVDDSGLCLYEHSFPPHTLSTEHQSRFIKTEEMCAVFKNYSILFVSISRNLSESSGCGTLQWCSERNLISSRFY